MARRTRGRFIRPAPRTKIWIGAGVGATSVGSLATVLISSLSAGALALRPFTVLRTHLLIGIHSDQSVSVEDMVGSFGHIVVTEAADRHTQ